MASKNILALVLAGGEGTRLRPLTADRAKPALDFAGSLRLIDFVIANLINSGIPRISVLAQYKPGSLIAHIETTWAPWARRQGVSLEVRLPAIRGRGGVFQGTADAVHQNLDLIRRHAPDLVVVFVADHVYRMDIRQMVDFHRERNADATVAAVRVGIDQASAFGVMVTDPDGTIHDFQEKPDRPPSIPDDPGHAYASMGNYIFAPRALEHVLEDAHRRGETDFGRHILPRMPGRRRIFAYDFRTNQVPGLQPYEERGYWRDVGTLHALAAARRDTRGLCPRFDLRNAEWPLRPEVGVPSSPGIRTHRIVTRWRVATHNAGGTVAVP